MPKVTLCVTASITVREELSEKELEEYAYLSEQERTEFAEKTIKEGLGVDAVSVTSYALSVEAQDA